MFNHWKWTGLLCSALIAIMLTSSGLIEGKGKPPKDDPPPETDLPLVRYRIKFYELPINAHTENLYVTVNLNDLGQVVGRFKTTDGEKHAFRAAPGGPEGEALAREIAAELEAREGQGGRMGVAGAVDRWAKAKGPLHSARTPAK